MLFLPPGTARVQRLHGAFVSDAEIAARRRLRQAAGAAATTTWTSSREADDEDGGGEDDEDLYDEMYDRRCTW